MVSKQFCPHHPSVFLTMIFKEAGSVTLSLNLKSSSTKKV